MSLRENFVKFHTCKGSNAVLGSRMRKSKVATCLTKGVHILHPSVFLLARGELFWCMKACMLRVSLFFFFFMSHSISVYQFFVSTLVLTLIVLELGPPREFLEILEPFKIPKS